MFTCCTPYFDRVSYRGYHLSIPLQARTASAYVRVKQARLRSWYRVTKWKVDVLIADGFKVTRDDIIRLWDSCRLDVSFDDEDFWLNIGLRDLVVRHPIVIPSLSLSLFFFSHRNRIEFLRNCCYYENTGIYFQLSAHLLKLNLIWLKCLRWISNFVHHRSEWTLTL